MDTARIEIRRLAHGDAADAALYRDIRLEALRDSPEADRNRAPRIAVASRRCDETGGVIQDGDVCVAESVNRLLAIANDEDRRRKRI